MMRGALPLILALGQLALLPGCGASLSAAPESGATSLEEEGVSAASSSTPCAECSEGARGPSAGTAGSGGRAASLPAGEQVDRQVIARQPRPEVVSLLDQADEARARGELERADRLYARALRDAATPATRLRGFSGAGTTLDLLGDPAAARDLYRRYLDEAPGGAETDAIRVRLVRLLLHFEQISEAEREARKVDLQTRTTSQKILLRAARALGRIEADESDAAEAEVSRGRALVEAAGLLRAGRIDRDVAALYFALGETRRLRAARKNFRPVPADFTGALEERAQLVLDAQSAYSQTMRAEDARWSARAGVRVGELYEDLHRDVLALPPPPVAGSPEKRALFQGAMRLRYSVLLNKAVAMMETTLAMLKRTGEETEWRLRAEKALERMKQARREEDAAIDALPYTRLQLQQALDRLQKELGGA